ncbi:MULTISPECIES: SpoIIE family protein phosphatase [Streptomyces]|uniref:ATP-binding SpoIIE family protein phosphatase n=1 Tax=Streptomyces TaxID=1883 RepID=UPI001CCF53A2|nr:MULTISPECIES: SpoIIE family protein phosphatase [Streptomyces]MBZ6177081.1 SpoIIE family protein phosphatase [Streptomyces olivaceus]MBZ6183800.1 SpoIIE family protein phosphatase [Streptomyces olivaceus]MCM8554091.1 SpoIIE family protein phosphatase [Streptomyces sp. STCH 565 A]
MEFVSAAATLDAHGTVTGWSEGARRLTGYPADEAVGRHAREMLAGDLPADALSGLSGTVLVRRRDETLVELRLRGCSLTGRDGEPAGYVVSTEPPGDRDASPADRAFAQAPVSMAVLDARQRYVWLNDVARRELGGPGETLIGRDLADTVEEADERSRAFLSRLRRVAETGRPARYETLPGLPLSHRDEARVTEMWPVRDADGEPAGTALAAFESVGQHGARERLLLLNEAANAIGTTLDLARTAEELVDVLIPRFADFASVDLLDWVLGARETPLAFSEEVVLHRVAHGSVVAGTPEAVVPLGQVDVHPALSPPARAVQEGRVFVSQAGEPSFSRWVAERESRTPAGPRLGPPAHSMMAVPLLARGIRLGVLVVMRTGQLEPYGPEDALFAEELASRAAVCIDNARRFARERATALAIQRSLLPRELPGQAALEVAHRYLPSASAAGIGGDWFDVIPLSGTRVALVVGDVVGHGIPSTATMGRLCTAVRTLADVDLPPDELLTHLDDLVIHLAAGADKDRGEIAELGATCLYAVYDPVSRRLTLAAAGHPAPAVLLPDGTTRLVSMTAGPPLGVGGLPFESTELELPEGAVVALYTDGLVEDRDRDPDHATAELCRALAAPASSLDALCDGVLKAVLPEEPGDDVALLLARTRALGADRVHTWDIHPGPAHVAATRRSVSEQLAAWGLDETAFVTELVVSELVTNAIRYGEPPIRLRLIRHTALICEVSDASSTSPHLRRAHAYDEGGRGLMLVAQLTQRWGSRQTDSGKTIWAEQPLPPAD